MDECTFMCVCVSLVLYIYLPSTTRPFLQPRIFRFPLFLHSSNLMCLYPFTGLFLFLMET
ncbi:hypothetical protein F4823DRAFT_577260 [Ustulina deusta]|nr:hypothetical protein F4823DRAFT_577260 [Ustulina deusta]